MSGPRPPRSALRGGSLLLAKDLRLLARAPGLLAVLVLYPLLVSVLLAAALQEGGREPRLAIVNEDTAGRTVEVAGERLSVDDYIARIGEYADTIRMDAGPAREALEDGRADAVITIPDGFVEDLRSGLRSPVIELATSRRSPIASEALERGLQAAVFRLNRGLAEGYVEQVVAIVDLVINGGRLGLFGRSADALGLVRSRDLVRDIQADLRAAGDDANAERMEELIRFIDQTRANLDLAAPAANAIRSPIELEVVGDAGDRPPLTGFGLAAALLVSIGLVGVLLGAAGVAGERDDNVLGRLGRGLVRPWVLAAEKMVLTTLVCTAVGGALLAGIAVAGDVAVGRPLEWAAVLLLTGLALGGLGALAGALARETRTALLAAFMLTVPLVALALIPGDGPAATASSVTPFGPAFDLMQALLVDPAVDGGALARDMAVLAVMAVVAGGAAALVLGRRARS